jgi:two-component system, OmpR family, phosphate regulon response regulator PhoB
MAAIDNNKHVLIVDRDIATMEPLRLKLTDAGYVVHSIADGATAMAAVMQKPPHLVIIDWNMPGFAALEVIQEVRRAKSPQPIRLIIVSALATEQDIVAGFNLGADDYIAKPFSLKEMIARVGVLLRSHQHEPYHRALIAGGLILEPATNRVTARGRPLELGGVEYRLLEFLMSHAGRTFNRSQLLSNVWGGDSGIDERTVDVNVQRLRKMLAESGHEDYIQTIRGFGYRFSIPTGAARDESGSGSMSDQKR